MDWTRATWHKSTHSADGNDCLEVAFLDHAVGLRNSKNRTGPMLVFEAEQWRAFIAALKHGEFDEPEETV